jgi:hypothetical protein
MRKQYDFSNGIRNPYCDKLEGYKSCTICRRLTPPEYQEKHHLVPKSRKGKETILVCRNCGDQLHKLFSNKEMERAYNTIEAILSDERIQKWIKWVKKKKDFRVCVKAKKKKR